MESTTYRALLIGNSYFPLDSQNLIELEGPKKDLRVLNNVLCDPSVGLFDDANVSLLQERPRAMICADLAGFFRGATRNDVLVVYYSGHGVLDDRNRLFLCANDTQADRDLLEPTAVSAEWINSLIDDSASQTCIVLLDCCHAGAFFKGGDFTSSFRGSGRYAVMSCRTGELVRDATSNGTSYFTQYFSEALRTAPDRDGDGYVGLADVFQTTRSRLVAEKKQRPTIGWRGEEDVVVARRATAPPGPPRDPITRSIPVARPEPPPVPRPDPARPEPPDLRGFGRNRPALTSIASIVILVVAVAAVALLRTTGHGNPPTAAATTPTTTPNWTGEGLNANPIDQNHWDLTESTGVTIEPTADGATIALGINAPSGVQGGNLTTRCLFRSDFDVQVSYTITDWPHASGARLGIVGGVSPQRINQGEGKSDFYQMNVNPVVVGSSPPHSLLTPFPTTDMSGQLRLRRVGSNYIGYARGKPDQPWTNIGGVTKPSIDPTHISLSVWGGRSDLIRSAAFNGFKILEGSCGI